MQSLSNSKLKSVDISPPVSSLISHNIEYCNTLSDETIFIVNNYYSLFLGVEQTAGLILLIVLIVSPKLQTLMT